MLARVTEQPWSCVSYVWGEGPSLLAPHDIGGLEKCFPQDVFLKDDLDVQKLAGYAPSTHCAMAGEKMCSYV